MIVEEKWGNALSCFPIFVLTDCPFIMLLSK